MRPHRFHAEVADRRIGLHQLPFLEANLPTASLRKELQGLRGPEFFRAHDRFYPGGSKNSKAWRTVSDMVRDRDGLRCCICAGVKTLQVDHIHPLSKGGENEWENLWTLCVACHSKKTGRNLEGRWDPQGDKVAKKLRGRGMRV